MNTAQIPPAHIGAAQTLWDYHDLHHQIRPVDIGIGLGSHDLGVATFAAELYHRGMFPKVLFSGANAPTTIQRFPRGEAIHYTEHAVRLGVPANDIITEPCATNTGENIQLARIAAAAQGIIPATVMLISRPYQQRRAYATCRKLWPEVEAVCTSQPLPLEEYVAGIGDADRVLNMLVGDTQRITLFAERGFAIPQPMPHDVTEAYAELVEAGYTRRILT